MFDGFNYRKIMSRNRYFIAIKTVIILLINIVLMFSDRYNLPQELELWKSKH